MCVCVHIGEPCLAHSSLSVNAVCPMDGGSIRMRLGVECNVLFGSVRVSSSDSACVWCGGRKMQVKM